MASYLPLSNKDDDDSQSAAGAPPSYSSGEQEDGDAALGVYGGIHNNGGDIEAGVPPASNYIHLGAGRVLSGTCSVDSDLPPLLGRFNNREERESAPNVYLSAAHIDMTIRISGTSTKKVKIVAAPPAGSGDVGFRNVALIRIIDARSKPTGVDKRHTPLLYDVTLDGYTGLQYCVVTVPRSFFGVIQGHCPLSGDLRNAAHCVISSPERARWIVHPPRDQETRAHGDVADGNDDALDVDGFSLYSSSVTFTPRGTITASVKRWAIGYSDEHEVLRGRVRHGIQKDRRFFLTSLGGPPLGAASLVVALHLLARAGFLPFDAALSIACICAVFIGAAALVTVILGRPPVL